MVNPAMEWFSINLPSGINESGNGDFEKPEESEESLYFTQTIQNHILGLFNNPASNFYNQIHEFFLNMAAYGTGIFYAEEDPNLPQLLFFRNINLRECYFEENRFGFVDSICRRFYIQAKLAGSKRPNDKLLQEKAAKYPDEQVAILHIVTPNLSKKNAATHSYSSDYILPEERVVLAAPAIHIFRFW
jgi:hypothetical protein